MIRRGLTAHQTPTFSLCNDTSCIAIYVIPIQWVPGALSMGVKQPVREADHSPPTSAEVKKMWIYTSTPPYAFMA
jgi:hypothetical protein